MTRRLRTSADLAKDVVLRPVDGSVSLDSYFFTADHHLAQVSSVAMKLASIHVPLRSESVLADPVVFLDCSLPLTGFPGLTDFTNANVTLVSCRCSASSQARVYGAEQNDEMQFKTLMAFCRRAAKGIRCRFSATGLCAASSERCRLQNITRAVARAANLPPSDVAASFRMLL